MAEDVRGPEALLKEVRSLPGLANVYFALQPNWVRLVERLQGPYFSISFAFSNPDGTISSKLLTRKHGLFGKEVHIKKWLDKPPLVQCSWCHALGHTANSCQCPIPKGDCRCAKCGGAHTTDSHARLCQGHHAVAGVCNCKLPCLNCSSSNHDCKSHKCPAQDNFRSWHCKPTDKGKGRANTGPETPEVTQAPGDPVPGAHPAVVPATNYPPLPPQGPITHPSTPNQQVAGPSVLPPPWSPWDLPWPFNMFDQPQYTISLVNMWKHNAVTHALLNFASHAHLLLIQEPWFDKIGTTRQDDTCEGVDTVGGIALPAWDLFYPTMKPGQRPKVMAYSWKIDTTTNKPPPFIIAPHPDLCTHPCLQILDIAHVREKWRIVNFYHDVRDKSALETLLALDLDPFTPTLVLGDFNTHSRSWSPDSVDPHTGCGNWKNGQ